MAPQLMTKVGFNDNQGALAHSTVEFCPSLRKPQAVVNGKYNMFKVFFILLGEADNECKLILLDRLDFLPQTISLDSLLEDLLSALEKVISTDTSAWKLRLQVPKYFAYLSNKLVNEFASL